MTVKRLPSPEVRFFYAWTFDLKESKLRPS